MGIITAFYLSPGKEFLTFTAGAGFLVFLTAFFRAQKNLFQDAFFGIVACGLFFIIGMGTVFLHSSETQANHYLNTAEAEDTPELLEIKIDEELKPGLYAEKYIGKVLAGYDSLNKQLPRNISGKLLLNIQKDSVSHLHIGDHILVPYRLSPFSKPLNPYLFDYGNYMKQLGVEKQLNLSAEEFIILKRGKTGIKTFAARLREKSIKRLRNYSFSAEEIAVIQALILGNRRNISAETYKSYAASGAVHILAVSGLHVGIILLLLNWLLKPLEMLPRGKFLKLLISLLGLWSYALVAGLSPSVIRAVSMFSFLAIGMQINRRTSTMNTLFMSLLVLLLINPFYILQVGFQLSYLAVFAIIAIQPKLYALFQPKSGLADYFWKILSVSIAAQIGVLPLSLFYFHQFPGLFFITNLVILPFLSIILAGGILIVLLALLDILPEVFAKFYGSCISLMNNLVDYIAGKESFLFSDIYFTKPMAIVAYLIIVTGILLIYNQRPRNVYLLLSGIIIIQLLLIHENLGNQTSEIIIFHKNRTTMLGLKDANHLQVLSTDSLTPAQDLFLKEYLRNESIEELEYTNLKNIYAVQGKRLLIIDSTGIYDLPDLHPNIVLLSHSPRINLDRLLNKLNPEIIIADGSNFKTYVQRWKRSAEDKKIPFHYTGEKGAFQLKDSD
ncbi:ComEC/Rec2 family competence protein [Zunongwangia sp. F363]|uniref:ComEC/Rec2 family competence protein n=1 Tax=Autumnicola tepida TaxID=3075595 RepID=A0ABU3CBG3_9FLAO|nr:ComEC/Rec2 family competence protein [Zunongwangia sp. F363]MDT0643666.1 ComEC/Rec2 family competence protein [Zunongwangia sp. F363]